MNNFDFSKKYPGISEEAIRCAIKSVTDFDGLCDQTILATKDVPPKALIFERIISARLIDDVSPYNYYFYEHGK